MAPGSAFTRFSNFSKLFVAAIIFAALCLTLPTEARAQTGGLPACTPEIEVGESCIDDQDRLCFGDIGGGLSCWGSGGGPLPTCSSFSAIGSRCISAAGQSCLVVGNNDFDCAEIGDVGGNINCQAGLGINAIVSQPCVDGFGTLSVPLLAPMTEQAKEDVLNAYQLPSNDANALIFYGRDEVRTYLFADILDLISKEDHSAEEAKVVDFFAAKVRDLRIRQAAVSEFEFNRWASDPCAYQPPSLLSFEVTWETSTCATPFGSLFGLPGHPSVDEFKAYGIAEIVRQDLLEDEEALEIAAGMRNAIVIGVSLVTAGLVSLVVGIALFKFTALGALLVGYTAPFSLVAFSTGVTGFIGGVVGIAGAVGIAIFAIIGSVIAIITYVDFQEFEDDVARLIASAGTTPNLKAEIATERGAADLFHAFIKSTQPNPSAPGNLHPTPSQPPLFFQLSNESGQSLGLQSSIALSVTEVDGPGLIASEVGLAGGWFAPTYTYIDEGGTVQQQSTYSLSIEFIDWDDKASKAARRGATFIIPQTTADGAEVLDAVVTDVLRFIDVDGNKVEARLVSDTTPPVITPEIVGSTLNDSGWYVSDVNVSWVVQDDESAIDSSSGCEPSVVVNDGMTLLNCTANSAGGVANQTLTIRRDATPPTINATAEPAANAQGWNNTDVVVTFTCTDLHSGVASCPADASFDLEAADQVVEGLVRDVAGNEAALTPFTLSIDKTAPDVEIAVPEDGVAYVLNEQIAADWSATDDLSGLSNVNSTAESGQPINTRQEGQSTFTVEAWDTAGNRISVQSNYTVLTPGQALNRLLDSVETENPMRGTRTALSATLKQTSRHLQAQNVAAARRTLNAFSNQVRAMTGSKIDPTLASAYLNEVEKILAALES